MSPTAPQYGYHYGDEGDYHDSQHETPWGLLQELFEAARDESEVAAIRVGAVSKTKTADYVDTETFWTLFGESRLSVEDFVDAIGERCCDYVVEGTAALGGDDRFQESAREEFRTLTAPIQELVGQPRKDLGLPELTALAEVASQLVEWAVESVEVEPRTNCLGHYPLPVLLIDGEWRMASAPDTHRASATIDYSLKRRCWCWQVVDGIAGDEATLQEAMKVSKEIVESSSFIAPEGEGRMRENRVG